MSVINKFRVKIYEREGKFFRSGFYNDIESIIEFVAKNPETSFHEQYKKITLQSMKGYDYPLAIYYICYDGKNQTDDEFIRKLIDIEDQICRIIMKHGESVRESN